MDYDIIIYAAVAMLLLARLWFVLGRRNDDDPQRPNPFITPLSGGTNSNGPANPDAPFADQSKMPEKPTPLQIFKLAPASVAGGLEQIKALDPTFNEKEFLQEARQLFTRIVEDFAKGDIGSIAELLGPDVRPHFEAALDARRQAGQTMESKVVTIRDAETVAAKVDGTQAIITVRFTSEQENTLRDSGGQVIGGEAGKLEEITDTWTFARDTKVAPPSWLLAETRA